MMQLWAMLYPTLYSTAGAAKRGLDGLDVARSGEARQAMCGEAGPSEVRRGSALKILPLRRIGR